MVLPHRLLNGNGKKYSLLVPPISFDQAIHDYLNFRMQLRVEIKPRINLTSH